MRPGSGLPAACAAGVTGAGCFTRTDDCHGDAAFVHNVLSLLVLNFAQGFLEGFGATLAAEALVSDGYSFFLRTVYIGVHAGIVVWFIQLRRSLRQMTLGPVANFFVALPGRGAMYHQYRYRRARAAGAVTA